MRSDVVGEVAKLLADARDARERNQAGNGDGSEAVAVGEVPEFSGEFSAGLVDAVRSAGPAMLGVVAVGLGVFG